MSTKAQNATKPSTWSSSNRPSCATVLGRVIVAVVLTNVDPSRSVATTISTCKFVQNLFEQMKTLKDKITPEVISCSTLLPNAEQN